MKKLGYFFLSFLPMLVALGIQFAIMFLMIGVGALYSLINQTSNSVTFRTLFSAMLSDSEFNACIMLIYSLTVICIYGLLYYRNLGGCFLPKLKTTFHPLQFVGLLVLVPGMQFSTSYLISILSLIFPSWLEQYEQLLDTAGLSQQLAPFLLLYAVIIGPIAEELIFRGLTLRSIRRVFPFWLANIFQAVLFGIYHMNWLQGCYAAVFGLVLGYVCEKGGSIYLSMFFHILYNLWGTVISNLLSGLQMNEVVLGILFLVTMVISLIAGGILFHRGQVQKALTVKRLQSQES